jgi:hypothetical protein
MPTTSERLRTLVEGLYIATNDGRLKWQSAASGKGFTAAVSGSLIEIMAESPDYDSSDIRINIFNKDGDLVDTFSDSYFGRSSPVNVPQASYYGVMNVLLEGARRSATGADKIVDTIVAELNAPIILESPAQVARPAPVAFDDLDDNVPF